MSRGGRRLSNFESRSTINTCIKDGSAWLNSEITLWAGSVWGRFRRNALGRLQSRRGTLPESYQHKQPPKTLAFEGAGDWTYASVVQRGVMHPGGTSGVGGFNAGGHNGPFHGPYNGGSNNGGSNNNGAFPGSFMGGNGGGQFHVVYHGEGAGHAPSWNGQMQGQHFGQGDGQGYFQQGGPRWNNSNQQQGGAFNNGPGFAVVQGRGMAGFAPSNGPPGQQQNQPSGGLQSDSSMVFSSGAAPNHGRGGVNYDHQGWQRERGRGRGSHDGRYQGCCGGLVLNYL